MKRISILIILSIIPIILVAQKTKIKTVKHLNSKVIKEEYRVLKKKNYVKHGIYTSYFENGVIKKTGHFLMNKKDGKWKEFDVNGKLRRIQEYQKGKKIVDKKVGIWLEYHEKGQVITGFDYDKNEKIETTINVPIKYPALARENEIQGIVKIRIKLNAFCELEQIVLVEGIGGECDKEAIRGLKKYYELLKKYDLKNCEEINKIVPIQFSLE